MQVLSELKVSSLPCGEATRIFPRQSSFFSFNLLSGGALLAVSLGAAGCAEKVVPPPAPPPLVKVTNVVQQDVPIYKEWVAQLNGPVNADITPKVQGYLLKRNYNEGFFVHKGDLLYEIDPRPFKAALDQSNAQIDIAVAAQTEAENNVIRDTPLAAQNAIPKKQLDTDLSILEARKAQVAAARASTEQAKLNLEWTKVYAPIDGVAGLSNSNVGDLVGTGTKMTTISQVNPIRAYFNISEAEYLNRAEQISRVVRGEKSPGSEISVEFIEATGNTLKEKGKIVLINREVTSQTGTIQIAAEFPNKEGILRPGGFGNVRIETGTYKNALLIPQAAVIEVQSIYQVATLDADNKANFRPVQVGERVGKNWIITQGLNPGDRVVVEGFMKLRQGMPTTPQPYVAAQPTAEGN